MEPKELVCARSRGIDQPRLTIPPAYEAYPIVQSTMLGHLQRYYDNSLSNLGNGNSFSRDIPNFPLHFTANHPHSSMVRPPLGPSRHRPMPPLQSLHDRRRRPRPLHCLLSHFLPSSHVLPDLQNGNNGSIRHRHGSGADYPRYGRCFAPRAQR